MCESIYLSGEQELLLDCAFAGKQMPHCERNPPAVLCVNCFSGDYLLLSCAAARQPGSGVGSVEAVLSLCIRGLARGLCLSSLLKHTTRLRLLVRACTQPSKLRDAVARFADDLSCAVFGMSNAVTIMFHTLQYITLDVVEGDIPVDRPFWLGAGPLAFVVAACWPVGWIRPDALSCATAAGHSVHLFNSVTAWLDLLLAKPRSFSPRARRMSTAFTLIYTQWILVCRTANGVWPYPFLNHAAQPQVPRRHSSAAFARSKLTVACTG